MSSGPFASYAALYRARSLSPIPLEPGTKRPVAGLKNWSGYCDNLPRDETFAFWQARYGHCGIGLCLGTRVSEKFRIGALDVDDERFIRAVPALLGQCPSAKRGKRGVTYFVRVPLTAKFKSTSLRNAEGLGSVDVLVGGKMTVLPPSIHPDTRAPYTWVGKSLLEAELGSLPVLQNLEVLKCLVGAEEAAKLATGHSTHDPGVRLVAKLVGVTDEDDLIKPLIASLLPKAYEGNSLDEVNEWIESARRKGFDQRSNNRTRKSPADILVAHAAADGTMLFHDAFNRAYASVATLNGGFRHIALSSSDAKLWLTRLYFEREGRAIGPRFLEEALNLLQSEALFHCPECATYLRVGAIDDALVIDLGQRNGCVVQITAENWRVTPAADVKMLRSPGFGDLPNPVAGGDVHELQNLLSLGAADWLLVLAFILLCLRPNGPYMPLLVEGQQGSGKSFLNKILKRLIDPNIVEKARLPESERDLMIQAQDFFLLSFDNVSGMKSDLSDALCTLSTGGSFATRKLYTDNELTLFTSCRPIMINGIADFVSRPDLLERSIILNLPAMSVRARRTEEQLLYAFDRMLPKLLGSLFDIVAGALRARVSKNFRSDLRMMDCARWLAACEVPLGLKPKTFERSILESQRSGMIERTQSDPVFVALAALLKGGPCVDLVGSIFERISGQGYPSRYFPPTPAHFSRHLKRIKIAAELAGLHFEFLSKRRDGQYIRLWLSGQEDLPPQKGAPRF